MQDASESQRTLQIPRAVVAGPWSIEVGSEHAAQYVVLESGRGLVLGSGRDADLKIPDAAVSARHCRVAAGADCVTVEDLGSTNGTFVGSARVARAELTGDGAVFVIGRTTVCIRRALPPESSTNGLPLEGLVGSSAPMRRVAAEVRRHAVLRAPVLLQGESGTGKDLVARALHALSGRAGAYVPLNAGAIAESLADAELFGHRRGAFTGAVANRAGAFEEAHAGTLFLDEVAELTLGMQVKLLRVVEDGMVRPVGASQCIKLDVRLVSASWADLEERVSQGQFRADLYHRLSTVVIRLPPLRQRKTDIPALSKALLERMRADVGTKRLSSAALARLVAHPWPGNVRELGSVLYRAAVAADGSCIQAQHIELVSPVRKASLSVGPARALALLDQHAGNVSAAARAAGVARSTFRSWLDRAGDERANERCLGVSSSQNSPIAEIPASPGPVTGTSTALDLSRLESNR